MKPNRLISALLATSFLLLSLATTTVWAAGEVWIDVRTEKEYQESSIPGHPNILYTEIADNIASVAPDKNAPIHLYCGTGRRAGVAKETLEKLGYTNVTNQGGIDSVKGRLANQGNQKNTGTPKNLLEGYR